MTDRDAEREFLRRSIDDLDRERAAGDLAEEDHRELRARYQAKLAALDASVSTHPTDFGGGSTQKRSVWSIVVTVVVVAAVGVAGGLAVARSSGEREPGEQITGDLPSTSGDRLAEAARLFQQGDVVEAAMLYDEVLAENPEDVEALTYKGWMLRNVGVQGDERQLLETGIELIEEALAIDPAFAEAWFFRGIIYLRDEDDPAMAVDALRLALANDPIPDLEAAARELLAEIAETRR